MLNTKYSLSLLNVHSHYSVKQRTKQECAMPIDSIV